jgi:UDP-N-acetylmuramate dehydrogenase
LGGGSNILFSDKGYNGLIIKINNKKIEFKNNNIICGGGVLFFKLVFAAKEKSLSGLEWAAGIPGTVGGAIFGNAGAFDGEIKDSIKEVIAFDTKNLKEKKFNNKECKFSYRNSIFKKTKKYIIISGVFALKKGNKKEISAEIKKNILYRKNNHPLEHPSAGSIFKNQKINEKIKKLFKKFPDLKQFEEKKEIPAAYLIYRCNLKGKKIGKAKISEKHTNFIINVGNAKAEDVISLINLVKKKVKNKFNIDLKEEIILK